MSTRITQIVAHRSVNSSGILYIHMNKKIQDIIAKINKAARKDIAFAGETKKIIGQSTGVELLDYALGCDGYPVGRITEIFGQPGSAKTSLALWGIAQAQRDGKTCMFIDAEFALDLEHAKKLGVDIDNLIIIQPDSGEEAFEVTEKMLLSGEVDFIVIDSVPSLVPTPEIESEINKPTMGGQARLIASGLRRLVPLVAKQDAVLIMINQLRLNIMGGQYDPYITPGGQSLKFYTSVRIEVKNIGKLKKGDDTVGQKVRYKMKKNKVGMNNDDGEFTFVYEKGFESKLNLIEAGTKKGVIDRVGNTYSFGDTKLGIGKEKAQEFLDANPELLEKVHQALRQSRSQ